MKSFKEFITEENNEEIINKLNKISYKDTQDLDFDWPEGLSTDDIEKLQDTDAENFNKVKNEVISALTDKGQSEDNAVQKDEGDDLKNFKIGSRSDIESDIKALKIFYNARMPNINTSTPNKFLKEASQMGGIKAQRLETLIKKINANANNPEAVLAKNILVFTILFKAISRKLSEANPGNGEYSLFGVDLIKGGLEKNADKLSSSSEKDFFQKAFNLLKNNNLNDKTSFSGLNKFYEDLANKDIDSSTIKELTKKLDKYEYLPANSESNDGTSSNDDTSSNDGTSRTDTNRDTNTAGTDTGTAGADTSGNTNTTRADTTGNSEKPTSFSKVSSSDLSHLTAKSSPDEVKAAIDKAYGRSEDGESKPEEGDSFYKSILARCEAEKEKADKLYKSSFKNVNEGIIFSTLENNVLVSEALKDTWRKIKNGGIHVGRLNTSAEHTENAKGGWGETRKEMKEINDLYYNKSTKIASKYTDLTNTSQRVSLITKLKQVRTTYEKELINSFSHAEKVNRYNFAGAIGHDVRKGIQKAADKASAAYKDSSLGRAEAMDKADVEEKVKNINVDTFKDFDEKTLPSICYAIKVNASPLDVNLKKPSPIDPKKSVLDFAIEQLKSSDAFRMDSAKVTMMLQAVNKNLASNPELKKFVLSNADKLDAQFTASKLTDEMGLIKTAITSVKNKVQGLKAFFDSLLNAQALDKAKRDVVDSQREPAPSDSEASPDAAAAGGSRSVVTEGFHKSNADISDEEKRGLLMAIAVGGNQLPNKAIVSNAVSQLASINGIKPKDVLNAVNLCSQKDQNYVSAVSKSILGLINIAYGGKFPTDTTTPETNAPTVNKPETNAPTVNKPETNAPNTDPLATAKREAAKRGMTQDQIQNLADMSDTGYSVVTSNAVGDYTIPDRLTKKIIRRRIGK